MSDDWIPIGYTNIEFHQVGDNSSSSSGQMFNLLQQSCQPEQPRVPPPSLPEESESRMAYTRRWLLSHDRFFTNEEPYAEDEEPSSQIGYSPQEPIDEPHPPMQHTHPEPRFHPYARPEDSAHAPRFHPYQQNLCQENVNLDYPQLPSEYSPLHSSLFLSPQMSPPTFQLSPQPGPSSPQPGQQSPQPGPSSSPKRIRLSPQPMVPLPQPMPLPTQTMQRSPQLIPFQAEPMQRLQLIPIPPEAMQHSQFIPLQPEPMQRLQLIPVPPEAMQHSQLIPHQPEAMQHSQFIQLQPEPMQRLQLIPIPPEAMQHSQLMLHQPEAMQRSQIPPQPEPMQRSQQFPLQPEAMQRSPQLIPPPSEAMQGPPHVIIPSPEAMQRSPQLIIPPSEAMHGPPQAIHVLQGEPIPGTSRMYLMPIEGGQPMEMGNRGSVQEHHQRTITTLGPSSYFVPQHTSPHGLHSPPVYGSPQRSSQRSPRGILTPQIYASSRPPQRALLGSPQLSPQRIEAPPPRQELQVQVVESVEMLDAGSCQYVESMEMSGQGSMEDIREPKGDDSSSEYGPPTKKPRMSKPDMPAGEDDESDDDF